MRLQLSARRAVLAAAVAIGTLAIGATPVAAEVGVGDAVEGTFALLDGSTFDVAAHRGDVIVIDFWATWCGPCEESLPHYAQLAAEHADAGLVVVAISVDERERDVRRFLDALPVPFDVAWDPAHEAAAAFSPPTMPTAYLVDRTGRVRHVVAGFDAGAAARVEDWILALLAEPPVPGGVTGPQPTP